MPAIDVSQFLQPGQTYTFTFEPVGVLSDLEHPDLGILNSSVQSIANVNGASVSSVAVPKQVGGTDWYNVTFQYGGDGSDVGAVLAQAILDAFNSNTWVSWSFVGANSGGAGMQQQNQGTNPDWHPLPSLPSSSSLWAIFLIVIIGAFLFYGGGGLVKKGISAAS